MNLKIAYVIDSSSGLSKVEAEAKGWYFLPLVITINNKDYLDGDDLLAEQYYQQIKLEDNVKTSATPLGIVTSVVKKAAQENDFVILYPLSKHLSSQLNNIKLVAKKIPNVRVVDSHLIAMMIEREIEAIQSFATTNNKIDKIIQFANKSSYNWSGLLVPKSLNWLVKGGRINASIAAMAKLLKIVPVIRFRKGKLEKEGKGRIYKKTCLKSFRQVANEAIDNTVYVLSRNGQIEPEIEREIAKSDTKIIIKSLPPIIANHCGPDAFIAFAKIK